MYMYTVLYKQYCLNKCMFPKCPLLRGTVQYIIQCVIIMGVNYFSREPLPGHWDTDLDSFQKMLVLKCIRLDRLTNAMQDFVSNKLGQRFIEPQTADLGLAFKDSSPTSALIFILSTVSPHTCTNA